MVLDWKELVDHWILIYESHIYKSNKNQTGNFSQNYRLSLQNIAIGVTFDSHIENVRLLEQDFKCTVMKMRYDRDGFERFGYFFISKMSHLLFCLSIYIKEKIGVFAFSYDFDGLNVSENPLSKNKKIYQEGVLFMTKNFENRFENRFNHLLDPFVYDGRTLIDSSLMRESENFNLKRHITN
jgi:hypothetical protein